MKKEVDELKEKYGKSPGLAVVLVGERKDSQTYVRNKKKACDEVGIVSYGTDLPETATEEEVLQVVAAKYAIRIPLILYLIQKINYVLIQYSRIGNSTFSFLSESWSACMPIRMMKRLCTYTETMVLKT